MVALHYFVLVFISSQWVYCHSNHRYSSSDNQKITLVCKNKDMIREFFKSLILQQDRTSLTVYLHVPASAVYSMMVCLRTHPNIFSFRVISFQECGAFATKHVSKDPTTDFRGYLCEIGYTKYEFVINFLCN